MKTLICSEDKELILELITAAKEIGSQEIKAVAFSASDAEDALAYGSTSAVYLSANETTTREDAASVITQVIEADKPGCLLVGNTNTGRVLMARIAAELKTSALTEALSISAAEGLAVDQMTYGGKILKSNKVVAGVAIIGINRGMYEHPERSDEKAGAVEEITYSAPAHSFRLVEQKDLPLKKVKLDSAKTVVCVGLGCSAPEQIEAAKKLAQALDGEIGCTRPVVDGDNPPLPKNTYIGVSGVKLNADLCFDLGCSGQMQHAIGIFNVKTVVGVNTNKETPLTKQSDYLLVGNVDAIVPALTAALGKHRSIHCTTSCGQFATSLSG